jgi:hypothetical protein
MHTSDGPPTAVGTTTRMGFSGNAALAAAALTLLKSTKVLTAAAAIFEMLWFIRRK